MRILLLANKDLASNLAINLLLKAAPQHTYSILLSSQVGNASSLPEALQQLAFFEQRLFNDIIFPLADSMSNKATQCFDSFDAFNTKGVSTRVIENINSQVGEKTVAAFKPNLIVSIRFGQILQQRIIDIPEFGVLNLHSGILPDYRGVMATFWAMLNEEKHYGSTLHYIDSNEIDAGNIVFIAQHPINYEKSYLHNVLRLYPTGVQQILEAIDKINGGLTPKNLVADVTQGNYFSRPSSDHIEQFAYKGNRLLDYSEIAEIAKWFYQSPFSID